MSTCVEARSDAPLMSENAKEKVWLAPLPVAGDTEMVGGVSANTVKGA